MNEPLNPRQKQVLTAIVDHYIVKAEPVSSGMLSQKAIVRASSATIRSTMSELEGLGMVEQPHASSGRLPTDLGYRTYVDELMHPEPLDPEDQRTLEQALTARESEEARLAHAAKVLADITRLLALVIPVSSNQPKFKKISLVPIEEGKVLLVLSSSETEIRSLLLEVGLETSVFRLESVANRVNQAMQGQPVSLLNAFFDKSADIRFSRDEGPAWEILNRSILKLMGPKSGEEIFLHGVKNLLVRQDFTKIEDIGSILELLDSKVTLAHLLRQKNDTDGVHVTVGEEHAEDGSLLRSLSVVTSSFRSGNTQGILGVLGPKRIPYAKLVPVVDYAAKVLSRRPENENTNEDA